MKRSILFTVLMFVFAMLTAQTDVTDTYLVNADFDSIPTEMPSDLVIYDVLGWTEVPASVASGDYQKLGTMTYGVAGAVGETPDNASSHTDGNVALLAIKEHWNSKVSNKLYVEQTVSLPAGQYTLKWDSYVKQTINYQASRCGYEVAGVANYDNLASKTDTWESHDMVFVLHETTEVTLRFGYYKNVNEGGGTSPILFVDNVKLWHESADKNAMLSSLTANVGRLSPAFENTVYDYTLLVGAGVESVDLTAVAASEEATVEGAGMVSLTNGKGHRTIKVTAADGVTQRSYTISILRNYMSVWNGDGATGAGSEPTNFGWSCSPATTGWAEANVFGIRFQDNVSYTYDGAIQTGRILYLRWDGTGGTNTATLYNYAVTLEACKTYAFSAKIAWNTNGSSPTYSFNVNSEKDNSGTVLVQDERFVSSAQVLNDVDFVFTAKSSGTYYLNIGATSAVLGAITDMELTDYEGDAFMRTSLSEMSFDSTSLSHAFEVSAYGLSDDITFVTPAGMTVSPATISPAEAQCGVEVTASFNDASVLTDGVIQLQSGALSTSIGVKEILPPYMALGTYELTDDGTWCWFQDPRAVYYEGEKKQTYTGWITSKGKVQVASLNHETGEVLVNTISPADFMQVDDHNNPTFLIREDGRILVSYSGHFYGPMRVIVSTNPEDIMSFGPEANFGNNVTYANPYQIGTTTTMFYRDGSTWHPTMNTSTDGGLTWGTPRELITRNGNQQRPYAKYTQDKSGGVHIIFTTGHPRQEASNRVYYIYFKNNKFYKADGTYVKDLIADGALNIDSGEAETIYDASNGKGWTWDITLDEDENPVLLYAAFPDDLNHHYYYAYWDGSQWVSKHIVNSGRWFPQTPDGGTEPEPNYSGGMVLDPNDPSIVYLSKQVNGVFEIYKYTTHDKGSTWATEAITKNTPEGTINVRPVIPRGHKAGSCDVVWMRGYYITYANFRTSVMYYSPNSLSTDLDSITINGVPLANFDNEQLSYDVELKDLNVNDLSIEAFAEKSTTSVEITLPSALPGEATIRLTSDGAVKTKVYTINIALSTALHVISPNAHWLYPNPVSDVLNVKTDAFAAFESLQIFNLQGREVMSVTDASRINVSALSKGIYIVALRHEQGSAFSRLVKDAF